MIKTINKVISIALVITIMVVTSSICYCAKSYSNNDIQSIINNTSQYMLNTYLSNLSKYGSEWSLLGLARFNKLNNSQKEDYYKNIISYVKSIKKSKLNSTKSTENSRVILALSSVDKECTNIDSYNLLEPLADYNYVIGQGLNGPIWALIAINSFEYNMDFYNEQIIDSYVKYILDNQLSTGGWTLFFDDNEIDIDITAMAIQALAPYYKNDFNVKSAVDKALNQLSSLQSNSGGFSSWGTENVESASQVLVALSALKIDCQKDERFIKNNNTIIDFIMSFSKDKGFSHIKNGNIDGMATEQAFYSLVSYDRLLNDKTFLYDMKDNLSVITPKDINNDGKSSIADCTVIQKYLVNRYDFTYKQIKNSDYNMDYKVSIADVTLMQKYFADRI